MTVTEPFLPHLGSVASSELEYAPIEYMKHAEAYAETVLGAVSAAANAPPRPVRRALYQDLWRSSFGEEDATNKSAYPLGGVGGGRDLHRLPHPVPHCIDDRDIHRLLAEIGQEFAQPQQGLARADRVWTLPAEIG